MNKTIKIGLSLFLLSFATFAQKFELTPQYGYQVGAKYSYNGGYLKLTDSGQYGFTFSANVSSTIQTEFTWTQQNASVRIKDILYPRETKLTDVRVNHYQIGAIHKFGNKKAVPFAGLSAGWSTFNPSNNLYSDKTKFTIGLTGGIKYFFTDKIGFRLQSQLLMPIQWGGVYIGTGGGGVTAGGSILQLNFSGGLIFAFGK